MEKSVTLINPFKVPAGGEKRFVEPETCSLFSRRSLSMSSTVLEDAPGVSSDLRSELLPFT
jgi:hypothetical protein